jgi:hypothetical protein
MPDCGGACRVARVLPAKVARELLTHRHQPVRGPSRGVRHGHRVTEPGVALTSARDLAESSCANAPLLARAAPNIVYPNRGRRRRHLDAIGCRACAIAGVGRPVRVRRRPSRQSLPQYARTPNGTDGVVEPIVLSLIRPSVQLACGECTLRDRVHRGLAGRPDCWRLTVLTK